MIRFRNHSVDPGPFGPVRPNDPDYLAVPVSSSGPGAAPLLGLAGEGTFCKCGEPKDTDRLLCELCRYMDTPEDAP